MVASLNTSRPLKDQTPVYQPRVLSITAATTLDDTHDGKTIFVDNATGFAITLPAASGTGWKVRLAIKTTITSGTTTIKVANTTDGMIGFAHLFGDDAAALGGFATTANTDDTITMDGSTRGGFAGDLIEIEDLVSGSFGVRIWGHASGTEATPFSATV